MAKTYTLDEALQIVFNDREYYLSLPNIKREKIRKYRNRFKTHNLTMDTKLQIVKEYGGKVVNDIRIKF